MFVRSDVTNEDDVKALVDKTVQVYGRLDYAFKNPVKVLVSMKSRQH